MTTRIWTRSKWLAVFSFCLLTGIASAKEGDSSELSRKESAKAWELQASSVATTLGLGDAETSDLVNAYQDVRRDHAKEFRKILGGKRGGNPISRLRKILELRKKYGERLKSVFEAILGAGNASKAVDFLGTFENPWDRMALLLDDFNLGDDKLQEAMSLVNASIVGMSQAKEDAIGSLDFDALLAVPEEWRTTLTEGLGDVLSDEQLAKLLEQTVLDGVDSGISEKIEGLGGLLGGRE